MHDGRDVSGQGSPGMARRLPVVGWLVSLTILVSTSCAHVGLSPAPRERHATVDTLTTALWRLDDPSTEDVVLDAGPHELHGTAGHEVRTDEGYRGQAKLFNGRSDSFIYIPYSPALDTMGTIEISAQVMIGSGGPEEDFRTIAARWTPRPESQSWILFLGGTSAIRSDWPPAVEPSRETGILFFALRTDMSPVAQVFAANGFEAWREGTWNQVAVAFDGSSVNFYINGRQDSSFPCFGCLSPSRAPLTIGNVIDRSYDTGADVWYRGIDRAGFIGWIDEVRVSRIGRDDSPASPGISDR